MLAGQQRGQKGQSQWTEQNPCRYPWHGDLLESESSYSTRQKATLILAVFDHALYPSRKIEPFENAFHKVGNARNRARIVNAKCAMSRIALDLCEIPMKGLILDKSPTVDTLVLTEPVNSRMVGKPEAIVGRPG